MDTINNSQQARDYFIDENLILICKALECDELPMDINKWTEKGVIVTIIILENQSPVEVCHDLQRFLEYMYLLIEHSSDSSNNELFKLITDAIIRADKVRLDPNRRKSEYIADLRCLIQGIKSLLTSPIWLNTSD